MMMMMITKIYISQVLSVLKYRCVKEADPVNSHVYLIQLRSDMSLQVVVGSCRFANDCYLTWCLLQQKKDEDDIYYETSLEFRRGGDGQPRRTRPTQQYYQPPRARD